jgi:hypothetical protein
MYLTGEDAKMVGLDRTTHLTRPNQLNELLGRSTLKDVFVHSFASGTLALSDLHS